MTGEAGIGKTSLAEAVDAMARALRFDIAWGRCSSSEMPSYWPWTQVLNSLLGTAELLEPGRFASRPELFSAVAEAIEARTRARAGLVIFEDEHWADPGSLGLLEFLAGMVAGQRLLLLITSRDDSGILFSAAGVRRIPLSGLDLEATVGARPAHRRCRNEPRVRRRGPSAQRGQPVLRYRGRPASGQPGHADRSGSGGGATSARVPARPAASGVGRPTPGGQRGRCAGCGPPRQRHRTGRGRGGGAPRRTGRGRCRGGRCLRP